MATPRIPPWLPVVPLLSVGVGLLAACAWMGPAQEQSTEGSVRLIVENHSFSDMTIFVERDGRLCRLGTITSKETRPFLITRNMLGGGLQYRLVADPIGSTEQIITDPIQVHFDATTHWMLEPFAWLSSVTIR